MHTTGDASARSDVVPTTHRAHVWILWNAARWLLSGSSASACCYGCLLPPPGQSELMAPVRWWRSEAARGIAELERSLAG